MQKAGNDFVKLCDAKFPYNPLPEIGEFLEKVPDYLKELDQALENKNRSESRQKLVLEFIKAYAKKQLPSTTSWEVIKNQNGTFTLTLHSDKKKLELSELDFVEKINKLN